MLTATQRKTIETRLRSMPYDTKKPILQKNPDVLEAIRFFIKNNPTEGIYLVGDDFVARMSASDAYRLQVRAWCRNIPVGTTVKISEPPDSNLVSLICEFIKDNQLSGLEFDSSYKKLMRIDMSRYFTESFILENSKP